MTDALIVVPCFLREPKDLEVILVMLESLRNTEPDVDVLIVDDASPAGMLVDEVEAAADRLRFTVVRQRENGGFARTVNVGLVQALVEGRDVVLANADLVFLGPWLDLMAGQEASDGSPAWVVGARLLYPSGLIQHAGIYFSLLHRGFDHIYRCAPQDLAEANVVRVVPVTGALQFIRHQALATIGLYDQDFRMGHEDVDYCLRAFLAGGECVYNPEVVALHYESMFRSGERGDPKVAAWEAQSWRHFKTKWATQNFSEWIPSLI